VNPSALDSMSSEPQCETEMDERGIRKRTEVQIYRNAEFLPLEKAYFRKIIFCKI
jgi:hypothetical protein